MQSQVGENWTLRVDGSTAQRHEPIRVSWLGRADERYPAKVLAPFFDELVETASSEKRGIEFHLEDLEHFNSATIAALIKLVERLHSQHIPLRLTFDARKKWQKMTFDVIRCFEGPDRLLEIRAI